MPKLEPAVRTPTEVATELGETYFYWKEAEALKEDYRKEFFGVVTKTFDTDDLARKVVVVPDDLLDAHVETQQEYVLKYNSGWRLVDSERQLDDGKFLIEEDPSLKGWDEVIILDEPITDVKGKKHPGYVVTKTIAAGSAMLDDDRLWEFDEELGDAVTEFANWDYFASLASELGQSEEWMRSWLDSKGWVRVIRKDISPDQKEAIKEYSYEGPRQVRLNVRYAKDDETPGG